MSWQIENGFLTKCFCFDHFVQAVDFINALTGPAEAMDHHPELLLHSYNQLKISLMTHSENSITEKDYQLAKKIDALYDSFTTDQSQRT